MRQIAREKKKMAVADKKNITTDGYQNLLANLGIGADNLASGGRYDFGGFITRQRVMLEAAYRTSWVVGQVVDVKAEDMIRSGIDINNDLKPDQIDKMQQAMTRLNIWKNLTNVIKWGRLYGGAVAIMLIDGQKMDTPLDIDTVGKGSFRGLLVLDRWLLDPSLSDLVQDFGPDFGLPKYYNVLPSSAYLPQQKVHHTRLFRFDGIELPYLWKVAENLWSESVIERLWDRLLAFDSTTEGAAQLVSKSHLRTVQVEGLREILAAGGIMEQALIKQFQYIRRMQSNEGITLLDSKDTFSTHQYTFSGLDGILLQFGQQLSGATGIPLVRLFGQSPSGLNSTGESDLRTYYDGVAKDQESQLKEPLFTILKVLAMSELSQELPPSTTIAFRPLWIMTDKEKSEISAADSTSIRELYNSGVITRKHALAELKQGSRVTGRFTNITEEDINAAENEPVLPFGAGEFEPDKKEGKETPPEDKQDKESKSE